MYKRSFYDAIVDFCLEEDGTTAVEYAVMIALILGVVIASATFMAGKTRESFDTSGAAISGAFGN